MVQSFKNAKAKLKMRLQRNLNRLVRQPKWKSTQLAILKWSQTHKRIRMSLKKTATTHSFKIRQNRVLASVVSTNEQFSAIIMTQI